MLNVVNNCGMVKILCVIFVFVISGVNVFLCEDISNIFSCINEKEVYIVMDEELQDCSHDIVHNGDSVIMKIDYGDIDKYNYSAITIVLKDMDANNFLKQYDVIVSNSYKIENMKIYDGYSSVLGSKIQIANRANDVVIGVPAICTSF